MSTSRAAAAHFKTTKTFGPCPYANALMQIWRKDTLGRTDQNQPLETVQHVDLSRYAGRWSEIARYPGRSERNCHRDATAEYIIKENGRIRVANAWITRTDKIEQSKGTAKVVDASTNAKLKVTFFWPLYARYWIIDLGDEYEYAVVGEPSRHYLCILSRSPVMQDSVYQGILHRLTSKGYEPQKLARPTQAAAVKPYARKPPADTPESRLVALVSKALVGLFYKLDQQQETRLRCAANASLRNLEHEAC